MNTLSYKTPYLTAKALVQEDPDPLPAVMKEVVYRPIAPQADTDELAFQGARLMFAHGTRCYPEAKIFVAAKGVLTCGWAIGLIHES